MKNTMLRKIAFLAVAVLMLLVCLPAPVMAAAPAAPSGLYCIPTSGQVDVYWTDNSVDETMFNIERAPDVGGLGAGTYTFVGNVPASTGSGAEVSFTDTSVAPQTAYWYRVAAVKVTTGTPPVTEYSFYSNETRVLTSIATPRITLTQPTDMIQSGSINNISTNATVSGTTVASAEYQFIADNAPGVFDARDIYATQMDLTGLLALGPRAPSPVANTMAMPANLPAACIAEFEIRGTVSAADTANGIWTIGAAVGAMIGTPPVANTVPPFVVYESAVNPTTGTRFIGSRHPVVGDAVKVFAYRDIAGGTLLARTITFISPAASPGAPALTLNFLYNGALTEMIPAVTAPGYLISGEVWMVDAGKFRIDAPYFPAYIDANVSLGSNVTVRFGTKPAAANIARQIFNPNIPAVSPTTVLNPVFDTIPVAYLVGGTNEFNVPNGTWVYIIVDGVVSAYDNILGAWTVGLEQIHTYQSNASLINPATVGDETLFYCVRALTPGPLVIESTYMILPGPLIMPYKPTAEEIHLMYNGTISYMGPNTWTVAGPSGSPVTFMVDDNEGKARIDPLPYIGFTTGMPVTVEFDRVGETLPDDANWASLTNTTGSTWNGTLDLSQIPVPANTTGMLFLRATDATKQGSTSGYPMTLLSMPTTVPLAPTLATPVQSDANTVTLSWTANTSGDSATSFIIERAPDVAGVAGTFASIGTASTSPYVDNTLTLGTYWYQVKGVNVIGTGAASNALSITIMDIPAVPTNLGVMVMSDTQVDLSWNDNATNETGYTVERSTDNFVTIIDLTPIPLAVDSTSFTDSTVTAASTTVYQYRITAVGTFGNSSATIATLITAPAAPTNVTIAVTGSITVSWVDNSTNETGFSILRAEEDPANPGSPLPYAAVVDPGNPTAPDVTSFIDTTVITGQLYWYQVVALGGGVPDATPVDALPVGAPSAVPGPILNDLPGVAPTPGTPAVDYNQVVLNWTDNSNNETGFSISRTPAFASPVTVGAGIQTYNDTAVSASTAYHYEVFAVNGMGTSATAAMFDVTTSAAPSGGVVGGGGGGAPSNTTIQLTGFSGNAGPQVNSSGYVQAAITLKEPSNECELEIAANTRILNSTGGILTSITQSQTVNPPAAPAGKMLLLSHSFGPSGAKFSPAINLNIKYDPAKLPAGSNENDLQVAWWDGSMWQILTTTINTTTHTATAKVEHFTEFTLMAPAAPPAPVPAAFVVTEVTVSPRQATVGQQITVSAKVTNTGGTEGQFELILSVNQTIQSRKTITLTPGGVTIEQFSIPTTQPGGFTVDVNGVPGGSFAVEAAEETTTTTTTVPTTTTTSTPATTTTSIPSTSSTTTPTTTTTGPAAAGGFNWWIVVGIVAGVIIVVAVVMLVLRRRD
jgi:hypothetical protein